MKSLVAVLILAAFLRIFQVSMTPAGLYWDELDTGYQAFSLLTTGWDYFGNPLPAHLQSFADYRSGLYIYLTVLFVKLFGLSAFSVRAPAIVASLLTIICAYLFSARVLGMRRHLWILPLVILTAPWTLVQGRIAAESQLLVPLMLLGLIGLYTKRYRLFSISFALSLWAYPTAKIMIPILILFILVIHRRELNVRKLLIPGILFLAIISLPLYETFSKPVGRRFSEVSVITDPGISKQVEISRQQAYLGGGGDYHLGLQAGILERLAYNKYTFWGSRIMTNYISALSTGFLFTSGDPNLRHNLDIPNTGQFYVVEIIPFLAGLFFIFKIYRNNNQAKLFLLWLLVSPLPAILTRDGGTHAPRLIFMLIPAASLITLGISRMKKYKIFLFSFSFLYLISFIFTGYYLFTVYRVKSASAFNFGFLQAARIAENKKTGYDWVILDGGNESLLMAYLFESRFSPRIFQNSFPLPSLTIAAGVEGYRFGNVIILYPGTRDWTKIKIAGNNLLITSSLQPFATRLTSTSQILFPDSSPAFIVAKTN